MKTKLFAVLLALLSLGGIVILLLPDPTPKQAGVGTGYVTFETAQLDPKILAKLAATTVHPNLLPVAVVFVQEKTKQGFVALGTLILKTNGAPDRVITAAHILAKRNGEGRCYYKTLRPKGSGWTPIERFERSSTWTDPGAPELDIILCTPGTSSVLKASSEHTGGGWEGVVRAYKDTNYPPMKSLLSGEVVHIAGIIHELNGRQWFAILYEGQPGESGLGFVSERNEVFVLSSGIEVNLGLQQALGLPPHYKIFTSAHAVKVNY